MLVARSDTDVGSGAGRMPDGAVLFFFLLAPSIIHGHGRPHPLRRTLSSKRKWGESPLELVLVQCLNHWVSCWILNLGTMGCLHRCPRCQATIPRTTPSQLTCKHNSLTTSCPASLEDKGRSYTAFWVDTPCTGRQITMPGHRKRLARGGSLPVQLHSGLSS